MTYLAQASARDRLANNFPARCFCASQQAPRNTRSTVVVLACPGAGGYARRMSCRPPALAGLVVRGAGLALVRQTAARQRRRRISFRQGMENEIASA